MADNTTTIQDLKDIVAQFTNERDWAQYHAPKNLSMDIAVEAAELMEKFLWVDLDGSWDELKKNRGEIENELVDVLHGICAFANACNVDLSSALEKKMDQNRKKYPVDKVKGKWTKYTKL